MKALESKVPPPIVAFLSAAVMFGRAKTTISPINIKAASALVATGIYRYTRNPMYLGLLMLLLAFTAYLAVPWALLGRSPSRSSSPGFKSSPKSACLQRNSATFTGLTKSKFAAGFDARDEGGHDGKL